MKWPEYYLWTNYSNSYSVAEIWPSWGKRSFVPLPQSKPLLAQWDWSDLQLYHWCNSECICENRNPGRRLEFWDVLLPLNSLFPSPNMPSSTLQSKAHSMHHMPNSGYPNLFPTHEVYLLGLYNQSPLEGGAGCLLLVVATRPHALAYWFLQQLESTSCHAYLEGARHLWD